MKIMTQWLLAVAGLLMLSCQTATPPNYYRLDAPSSLGATAPGPSLGLAPVEIPEYLVRSGLVRDTNDLEVEVSTSERWAEPLESGIARIMALNLARTLPTNDIRPYPWNNKRSPDIAVRIKVTELRNLPERATLVAETVITTQDGQFTSELISLQEPLTSSAQGDAIAAAYSALFAELSEALAKKIQTMMAVKADRAS